jgi:hypothetical protein
MMFKEIVGVSSENHAKLIPIHHEQNTEFMNIKAGGTYGYHWVLKS